MLLLFYCPHSQTVVALFLERHRPRRWSLAAAMPKLSECRLSTSDMGRMLEGRTPISGTLKRGAVSAPSSPGKYFPHPDQLAVGLAGSNAVATYALSHSKKKGGVKCGARHA